MLGVGLPSAPISDESLQFEISSWETCPNRTFGGQFLTNQKEIKINKQSEEN